MTRPLLESAPSSYDQAYMNRLIAQLERAIPPRAPERTAAGTTVRLTDDEYAELWRSPQKHAEISSIEVYAPTPADIEIAFTGADSTRITIASETVTGNKILVGGLFAPRGTVVEARTTSDIQTLGEDLPVISTVAFVNN